MNLVILEFEKYYEDFEEEFEFFFVELIVYLKNKLF